MNQLTRPAPWPAVPQNVRDAIKPLPPPGGLTPRTAAARTALGFALSDRVVWNCRDAARENLAAALTPENLSLWWVDPDDYEADPNDPGYQLTPEGFAVVPMVGVLLDEEESWWMRYLGATSIPALGRRIAEAYDDRRAPNGVIIASDSPGGHAAVSAVADIVADLVERGEKPIVTIGKQICSAAYHIASQTERISLTADGDAGCIGTLIVAQDWSGMYGQMGASVDRVTSDGAETYKGAGVRGTVLTPEIKADWKRLCNESQALFNQHVARGRGISEEDARALADGRIHIGRNAVALGLVDAVLSVEQAYTLLTTGEAWPESGPPEDPPTDDDDPKTETKTATLPRTTRRVSLTIPAIAGKGKRPMDWFKTRTAAKPAAEPTTDDTAQYLSAEAELLLSRLQAAGIDSPEKFAALQRQAAEGEKALAWMREEAEKLAATALKPGTDELAEAKEILAACDSFVSLKREYLAHQRGAKAFRETVPTGQQTQSETVADKDGGEDEADFFAKQREAAKAKETQLQ